MVSWVIYNPGNTRHGKALKSAVGLKKNCVVFLFHDTVLFESDVVPKKNCVVMKKRGVVFFQNCVVTEKNCVVFSKCSVGK